MKKITAEFTLSIGYTTATREAEEIFEFDDDATDEEIEDTLEDYWKEWAWNYINGGWDIKEE